ncbi:unnamed protein product [Danaus chrysippus]|uniref:(African queen) hypothetical protein n=1 Tax=Danaus chrysippus TaxID=151541 RepID=A0A8J2VSL7_9NEOP|nr:unnamed protein product [Danaus chrysippus]
MRLSTHGFGITGQRHVSIIFYYIKSRRCIKLDFEERIFHELVAEKEKYKDIGDDLDTAFVELILKE